MIDRSRIAKAREQDPSVSVPASKARRELIAFLGEFEPITEKLEAILRIAAHHGDDYENGVVVMREQLAAWGVAWEPSGADRPVMGTLPEAFEKLVIRGVEQAKYHARIAEMRRRVRKNKDVSPEQQELSTRLWRTLYVLKILAEIAQKYDSSPT